MGSESLMEGEGSGVDCAVIMCVIPLCLQDGIIGRVGLPACLFKRGSTPLETQARCLRPDKCQLIATWNKVLDDGVFAE